jgi:hypothetical protein
MMPTLLKNLTWNQAIMGIGLGVISALMFTHNIDQTWGQTTLAALLGLSINTNSGTSRES